MSEDNREKLLDKIISLISEYGVSGAGILGGLVVAFLIIALFDHEKRLEASDTLSRRLGQQIEKLTKEKEELKQAIESKTLQVSLGTVADYTVNGGSASYDSKKADLRYLARGLFSGGFKGVGKTG